MTPEFQANFNKRFRMRVLLPGALILLFTAVLCGGALHDIPRIDSSKYPQIMAAPPVGAPADYFALTRILLVPSIWPAPFEPSLRSNRT